MFLVIHNFRVSKLIYTEGKQINFWLAVGIGQGRMRGSSYKKLDWDAYIHYLDYRDDFKSYTYVKTLKNV
jgi:hypothetical protein